LPMLERYDAQPTKSFMRAPEQPKSLLSAAGITGGIPGRTGP
jgi:hypothetical protein